jgi:hypothetical protein
VTPAQPVEGGDHGRAGGQAVVQDDHNPPGGVDGGSQGGVLGSTRPDGLQLTAFLVLDVFLVRSRGGGVGREVGPAALVDRADRELRLSGGAQLAHQHHVELAPEPVGDDLRHRHGPAGDGQDQRVLALVRREFVGEPARGLFSIMEHDLSRPGSG